MTLNQLIELFESIGNAHYFIKHTEFGDNIVKPEANIEDVHYPAFYQILENTTTLEQTINRTFKLIVCDLVYPDKENINEVWSDTEQTLNDVIKILRQESDYYTLLGDPQLVAFKDRYGDDVAGWEAEVTIETINNSAYCDIPAGSFGFPGGGGSSGIPPVFLTCATLEDCSVIQTIIEDIYDLESQITEINGDITDINNLISSIQNSIITINIQIGVLQGQVISLQNQINNLPVLTFDNGLTQSGVNTQWGGLLTQNTDILGANLYNVSMGTNASKLGTWNVYAGSTYQQYNGDYDLNTDNGAYSTPYIYFSQSLKHWEIGSDVSQLYSNNGVLSVSALTSVTIGSSGQIILNAPIYQFATLSADRVPYINGSSQLVSSGVSSFELSNLIGSTSNIQSQINGLLAGLSWKQAVKCATTGNITLSGEQVIDGITTSLSRVLVKNQSTPTQNGIYLSGPGAWARVTDADTGTELVSATVFVSAGVVNSDTQWTCTNDSITIGVTNIVFAQVSGAGTYAAGYGLDLTGNIFSISTSWTGQTALTTLGTITTGTWNGTPIDSAYIAAMTSAQFAGIISDETGSGLVVFNDSPTFTTQLTSPKVLGGTAVGSALTLQGTSANGTSTVAAIVGNVGNNGATNAFNVYNSGQFNIGNYATPTAQRLFTVGQDTAYMSLGSLVGTTSQAAIYLTATTPSSANYSITSNGSDLYLNTQSTTGNIYFANASNIRFTVSRSSISTSLAADSSGATTSFTFTVPAHTGQTASTNIPNFRVTGNTKTWATGAITNQYWNYLTGNTAAFVGASTITNSYGLYVEATTLGANATITNNYSAGFASKIETPQIDGVTTLFLNGKAGSVSTGFFGQQTSILANTYQVTPILRTSGANSIFDFRPPANTNQTASTQVVGFDYNGGGTSQEWATGTVAVQREVYFRSRSYTAVGASTFTKVYGMYVEPPTASTNVTFTNRWALGVAGNFIIDASAAIFQMGIDTSGSDNLSMRSTSFAFNRNVNTGTIYNSNAYAYQWNRTGSTTYSSDFLALQVYNPSGSSMTNTAIAINGAGDVSFTANNSGNIVRTASIENPLFKVNSVISQWATGALTTQRMIYFPTQTAQFSAASTISEAYGLYVESVTAGTNATITNNFALGLSNGSYSMKFGQLTGTATTSAIYFNQSTPSATTYSVLGTSTDTTINAPNGSGTLDLRVNNNLLYRIQGTLQLFQTGAAGSGAATAFTYSPGSNTSQTASAEINGFLYNSYTRTWAAGAITTQREQYIKTVTYAFASASTITSAYGLYVEAPTAGTNATITNNYALGVDGNISMVGGNRTIFSSNAITLQSSSGSSLVLNCGSSGGAVFSMQSSGTPRFVVATSTNAATATNFWTVSPTSNTNQTASTELNGILWNSATRQWAAGAITTQREWYFKTQTYSFVSASTITDAYGLYVEAATAGTNATITNNWAAGFYGSVSILNNGILKLGNAATTGLVAGALAATTNASIVLYDSTGQAYRIPCII